MSTTPVTIDPSTFTPLPQAAPGARALQGAVSYGTQQDPERYAKLLRFQQLTGVPPAVSQGNEDELRQQADMNRLDPHALVTTAPRTTAWATNPDNAAVAGVDEIHRVAGFEQHAAAMRAYTPTLWDQVTTGLRQAVKSATGKTTDQLQQGLYEYPLARGAVDVAGGTAGMVGNIGSFVGWHGDDVTKQNLLQRVETHLAPENNTDPAAVFHKSNEFDWLMKNVAPMVPAVLASGGVSALARALKLSDTASKVLAGLTVGAAFDADQAGKTYTEVAGAGGSDKDARLAANRVALINAPANALFGATDVVPLLRDNPLLTSLGLGGATGATGQIGQNVVTGQPWAKGVTSAMVQGAAMQGGMHVGLGAFAGHVADAVDSAEQSKLRERSPEKFGEAMQTVFAGDASLKIPADAFQAHFTGAGMDPAEVAKGLGSTNYAEAVLSGGVVEVHPADYLSKLDSEHQKALLPHIVDPETGLTATQHAEGLEELQQWAAGDGPEKLQAEAAQADAETAATPEYQAVKEDLRQRYVDAGETPEVADSLATNHANVVANLARESGRTPAELMAMYSPKVTIGDVPGAPVDIGQALADKISGDFEGAVREYSALPDTKEGRVLNTDEARELSEHYRADRSLSAAVHEPASQFIKDLYARKLAEPVAPGRDPLVLFTAGGTGAGKSTSLRTTEGADLESRADIIYDTNMNKFESADQKIQQALASGREVEIQYTYREPVEALVNGALPRAMRMGRTVPLNEHARTHVGARATIDELRAKYADDPRVEFSAVDNSLGKGNARAIDLDSIPKIDDTGVSERLRDALEAEYQSGKISDRVYRGFGETRVRSDAGAEGASETGAAADDRQSEPRSPEALSPRDFPRVASPNDLKPYDVGRVPIDQLHLDPSRFQYKMNTDVSGVTNLLKGRTWNEDLAGVISVWRDPADGETYVVNGHHRFQLAKETGQRDVAVRMIAANDAAEARAKGAIQNIAEGRGTAMDAAKFFRDSNATPEQLDRLGVSMGEATAANGVALARLDQSLFDQVVNGKLPEGRAIAIGNASSDPAEQEAILKLINKAEAKGKHVTNETVNELARMVKGAGQHTETQDSLFGAQEMTQSLALEKAEVSSYIRKQISTEQRTFASVSSESKAARLGTVEGQSINAAQNRSIAENAAIAKEIYDRLSVRSGTIDAILNRAARELAEGGKPNEVKSRAYADARQALGEALAGADGLRGGVAGANEGGSPAGESGDAATASDVLKIFYQSPKGEDGFLFPAADYMAEREQARINLERQAIEDRMRSPKGDISKAAGAMERDSPLWFGTGENPTLFQSEINGPVERAGWRYDSPEMAEARRKAEEAEADGNAEVAAEWTEKFYELREAEPRFQRVLAAREAYLEAREKSRATPGNGELAKAMVEAHTRWKDEAAKMRPYSAPATGEPRGWFRMLPDGSFEIGKTKVGDLSTFVHEPAHAYLHMLRDLVGREGASDALKDDYAKVLDFLGAKDGEALTREQQEKWARANEQYLREGKAPSEGLKGVFQRFAVWLGSIYKKATDLGVELTPEIREVFDRMYASEEGVNRAAQEAGPPLFTKPEDAGWTDAEFKRYAEDNGVSVAAAKSHVLGMLNEAAVRQRTQAWRDEEANVRQAMAEQIDARPEYKAIRQLRKGELEDGTPLTLNRDALVAQFGEDRVRKLQEQHPGLYRAKGNADPEAAAELHGFGSAEEMMQALEAAPRRSAAIDQATRAYMTEKYGDIRYDGTLDSSARVALENDTRAEGLYRELKALKKKLAKIEARQQAIRDIEIAPLEAYRDAAHQMVEKKAVADLQPTRYLDASRKYSREAFDALRRGDAKVAADAKHKELMNHFLFREATDAKAYVGKFEAYAKRAQGKTVQGNLGLAGSDYRAQFNKLMFRYGLTRLPAEMPERPLSEWADDVYEQGKEPALDPALLDESRGVNYRRASVAEVRALHDALKNIKALAYQEMHAVVNGRKVAFADAKTAMMARARESLQVHPEAVFAEDRELGEKARDLVNRGLAPLIRTEFLMKRLDGGVEGPWHDYLWNLAADAQGVERELQEGVTKIIGDALQNMPETQRKRMLDKVVLPGWGELTRKRLISMALNLGNDGNLDRLRKTFAFHGNDPAGVAHIPQMLTREDWQLVQGLWDSLKPMGERMNELERRLTGLPPVMVKPTPLHVDLADGSSIDLEGGYYPIVMDPRYSERAQQQDVNVTARNLMESGYGRAATSRGYTKERTGFAGPLLLDHEQVLTQHIAKASKDISHREFILAANRLLGDKDVQQSLRETVGKGYEEQMMPWLRTIVNDRNGSAVQGLRDFSNWMTKLRTNVVEASLGFKLSTLLLQVTHASSVFLHTSAGSYAQAMVNFLAHPDEMTEQIRNLSPNEMKHRGENIDRDMRAILQDGIQGRRIGAVIAKAGMFPVKMVDHVLSFPLWLSVYQEALAEHAELPEERAQYLAMHKADGAVRMALGSNAPKDLPAVMRRNDFWKMVTTLGGFENLKLNQIADATVSVGADRRAGVGGAATAGRFTYRMLMAAIIPAVVGAYVHGNRPKDDENSAEWAAKRALLFAPETVPLLGNIVRAMDQGGDAQFTPIVNVVDKAVKAGTQAGSDKEDKDWTGIGLNAGEAAGMTAGVPGTVQAARTLRYAHRAHIGQIEDPNAWNAVVGSPHK